MPWFSLLPAHLTIVETWIIRFFLLLGTITIGPWLLALVYDMVLYLFRAVAYEIPYYGGRAQGRRRPQAPTLTERPNGRKRTFSITGPSPNRSAGDEKEAKKRRSFDSDREDMDDITEEGSQMSDRLSSWGMRLIRTESRAMRSTDLWDASTDSRFISGPNATKKRR